MKMPFPISHLNTSTCSQLIKTLTLTVSLILGGYLPMALADEIPDAKASAPTGIVGDGVHDDTEGIQALLDMRRSMVFLPPPSNYYLISKPLRIHSHQTLQLDRFTVIRLKDSSDCLMITNDDHERGNVNIALIGGIWDMHNEGQSLTDYQKTRNWKGEYDPSRYLGILMRFNRVKNLVLRSLTLKDPVTFSTQLGNLEQFTVEDITFDYNLKRTNMDGIHVHGNSRFGRISNLKGATNDDMVALNADDGAIFEMARGPIEDISIEGLWAKDGYTAVRLLSAGSPIKRIQVTNIFGTYRYNVVSFTNHNVHPGSASTFEDISLRGFFIAKSGLGMKFDTAQPGWSGFSLIWIDAPALVSGLNIYDLHRNESISPAATILIEPGATVKSLQLNQVSVLNHTPGPLDLLVNHGTIEYLSLSQVWIEATEGPTRGSVVRSSGKIGRHELQQVFSVNTSEGIVEESRKP
jgi:hypothetical protein